MFGRRRDSLQELIRSQHEESRASLEKLGAAVEEFREFNREILLRNEKVYTGVIARLEEMGEEIRSNTEETRAQTRALMRVLDRLDRLDGGTAAA